MFGFKQEQNHRQQFMNELSQSVDALRRAAGHAAAGTRERFSPTYDRARHAAERGWGSTRETLNPIYQQLREGAHMRDRQHWMAMMGRDSQKQKGSRFKGLASLLAAGAAVGAAGAAVARRRRQQAEWEEYDPMTGETRYFGERSRYADESAYGHRSAREKVAAGAASMADSVSDRAGRIADTLHERSAAMHEGGTGEGAHAKQEPPRPMGPPAGPSSQGAGSQGGVPGTTPNPPGNPLTFPDEP